MRKIFGSFFLIAVFCSMAITSVAQGEENSRDESQESLHIRSDIKEVQKEIAEVRKELKELRVLIESRLQPKPAKPPRPVTGKTGIKGDPSHGSDNAPLVLVEFSDFQCPYCGKFTKTILPQINAEYINKGLVRHVFKDFPLAFHKDAQKAAEAAHCAGEVGMYWQMHDILFEKQRQLSFDDLLEYAGDLGLHSDEFKKCLNSNKYAKGVVDDMNAGKSSGVTGTPSFILGRLNAKGEVEGKIIRGAQPYTVFKSEIDAMLKKK